ncbi:MAG: DUF4174 domain-containing protein [Verrucomicrobiota bacterium]
MKSSISAGEKKTLADYRWDNRIILMMIPTESKTVRTQVEKVLIARRDDIADRDLVVLDLSPNISKDKTKGAELVHLTSQSEANAIRKKFGLESSSQPVFVLIGKDGGEKSRQTGRLDLSALFTLIDTMPMRRQEMRQSPN